MNTQNNPPFLLYQHLNCKGKSHGQDDLLPFYRRSLYQNSLVIVSVLILTATDLKSICYSVQKFNYEERWHFCLYDRHKEDFIAIDADEVVMWRGDDRRHVLDIDCFLLSFEEIITHRLAHNALPVLLQEYITRTVYKKQAVDHFLLETFKEVNISKRMGRLTLYLLPHSLPYYGYCLLTCTVSLRKRYCLAALFFFNYIFFIERKALPQNN